MISPFCSICRILHFWIFVFTRGKSFTKANESGTRTCFPFLSFLFSYAIVLTEGRYVRLNNSSIDVAVLRHADGCHGLARSRRHDLLSLK